MLIRDANPAQDAAACAEIYAPYVEDTAISLEERPPGAQELAARIDETTKTHPWLIAEDADRLIGYAYATRHRERASYRWATDVAVYVAPDRQRGGVGRALYQALFDRLAEQGFRVACAGITLPNDASVGLHEALGFEPIGVYRNIGWKLGAWRDVGWWQRQLRIGADGPPPEPRPARQTSLRQTSLRQTSLRQTSLSGVHSSSISTASVGQASTARRARPSRSGGTSDSSRIG